MKKDKARDSRDDLRAEYRREDFGELVRGKYASRAREASNVVVLSAEVAKAFPNDAAVNEALLSLIRIARATREPKRRSVSTTRKRTAR